MKFQKLIQKVLSHEPSKLKKELISFYSKNMLLLLFYKKKGERHAFLFSLFIYNSFYNFSIGNYAMLQLAAMTQTSLFLNMFWPYRY
jgi:hypothetical protein